MTEHESDALYLRWANEMWNVDAEVARELVTPDFIAHWPGRDFYGPDGLIEAVKMCCAPFDNIKNVAEIGPISSGDLVAARWTLSGIYRGGTPGATAPLGTPVSYSGHDILRVADGRFTEYWFFYDMASYMSQLAITDASAFMSGLDL